MAQEDRKDDALGQIFEEHREVLARKAVKATLESIRLRRIIRR